MAENPFPCLSPLQRVWLAELIAVARLCYERGWSWGTAGNFSLRDLRGIVWQSPSGVSKGELTADGFIPVQGATGRPCRPESPLPSLEMPVHLGMYRSQPEARCVVHTHPPAVVRVSRGRSQLCFEGLEMAKVLGAHSHLEPLSLPIYANLDPEAMAAQGAALGARATAASPMIILEGHGVYAWGRHPKAALAAIEALETLCEALVG